MTEIFVGELCSIGYRICARFDATGEVQPTLNKHRPYLQRLDQQSQLYVVDLIMENLALYLAEIGQHIHEVFALNVTPSTVCRLLRSYGITRKKISCIVLQRVSLVPYGIRNFRTFSTQLKSTVTPVQ